ncbi:MAG: unsaturated rhamnogalacturonyl hydrolase [Acidobacteriaceae bacterium]|nr:unsaturated rhamnogalacturonyl hydrolase [Acidobacteriaceae bacterium]
MISRFHPRVVQIANAFRRGASRALPVVLFLVLASTAWPQQLLWSQRVANSTIHNWPAGRFVAPDAKWVWNYELGVLLNGMGATWFNSADGAYYHYVKQAIDQLVGPDGSIPTYNPAANSLDNIAIGRQLLLLYRVTQDAKYYKAATLLRRQLSAQPRNASGGFWHKQIYPDQMWLDGLYMAEPFYAEYASVFHEPDDFADIAKQFSLIEEHARSQQTGLLYHGWDESRKQAWANKVTGTSHVFWARGMGWYMMALVDTLPYYSKDDPNRATLLAILNRTAAAAVRYQDKQTGLWDQVLDRAGAQGNYFESSAACMFTYALQKGVRFGYLPEHYSENAARAWQGILSHFVQTDASGSVTITNTVKGIGLGGSPYHDGTYAYYVGSPVVSNDPKGVGAFLLASTEMELAPAARVAGGETVMLDAWFNSQQRQNAAGQEEYFHYKWSDYSDSGFSLLGHILASHGATLDTLYQAPTMDRLKGAQFYVIVSPDNPAKNPHLHYVQPQDAEQVAEWVKQGGVLVLMENDPANSDITHLDSIADRFGIHFDDVLKRHIVGDQFAPGYIPASGGPIFHHSHTLYMKDTCGISLTAPAQVLLEDKAGIVMATAKYGRGTVVAVVDPWLYNEYTDHRKALPQQDNYAAGKEFVTWLLKQAPRDEHAISRPETIPQHGNKQVR